MDNLTKEQRSFNMSKIKSSNTKLEISFFKILDDLKIKYKKHPKLFGNPDCLIDEKILIFIDSDFWHGWYFPRWRNRLPSDYWVKKIENNIKRDRLKFKKLQKMGFNIYRFWAHEIKNKDKTINKIKEIII